MTENPFQLPGYQVIGMQDTGVAFDVHLQPPSPVACSSCGTIGDFVKNGTRDIRVMDLPVAREARDVVDCTTALPM